MANLLRAPRSDIPERITHPISTKDRTAVDWALSKVRDGTLSIDGEGRIWRHEIMTRVGPRPCAKRRAENVNGNGYLRLTLQIPGSGLVQTMAHRVVWESLHGPIPDGLQINHKDLNKQNNHPSNLELATGTENIRHSHANGRNLPWSHVDRQTGLWRGRPLVTPEQIAEIRNSRTSGMLYREIANLFGLSIAYIHRVCTK